MTIAEQIRAVLRRYSVYTHYRGTQAARKVRYAVWCDGKQIGEPLGHAEAQARREDLIVADLTALIEGNPA